MGLFTMTIVGFYKWMMKLGVTGKRIRWRKKVVVGNVR